MRAPKQLSPGVITSNVIVLFSGYFLKIIFDLFDFQQAGYYQSQSLRAAHQLEQFLC